MKRILLATFLLPLFCLGQKIALIDRQLQKPITYVDNISMKNIEQGYFIIYEKDIEDVVQQIESMKSLVSSKKPINAKTKSIIKGSTYFTSAGKTNNYHIIMDTKANMMGAFYVLSSKAKTNEENLANMDRMIAYLRSGKS
ncbi:MAG: hypothetical protein WKF70_06540 [Chitinophagaceae bacterium]